MKKGFTLIEIIITIGLIALIGTVIVSNLSATYTKNQDEQYENFKKTLENAACTYIDLNMNKTLKKNCQNSGSCSVTVGSLLSEGLIEDSDLKNPKTNEQISESKDIKITYSNKVKSCTYEE